MQGGIIHAQNSQKQSKKLWFSYSQTSQKPFSNSSMSVPVKRTL
jgi:hypothetical protein